MMSETCSGMMSETSGMMSETCNRCHAEFLEVKVSATTGLCVDCAIEKANENLIKDGGPAFPTPIAGCTDGGVYSTIEKHAGKNGGMSLRDWFAGMALQGLLAQSNGSVLLSDKSKGAKYSYEMADAMLKAREVKP